MKPLYSISKKLLMSNYKRLSSPCKITFAITYACTFLCKTCNIGRNYLANPKKIKDGELSYEEIGNIFKNSKSSWLQLTGGEPFIRDVYQILKSITEYNDELYVVHTTTNGFDTKNIVEQVKKILTLKIPRFAVSISLDGYEEAHNEIRGIKDSFNKCLTTFRELQKLENKHFNVFISYTSSPYNMGKIESFIQNLGKNYGIDPKYIHMNLYHTSNHYFKNSDQQKTVEYNKSVINEIRNYRKLKKGNDWKVSFFESRYSKFVEKFVETGKSPLPCKALNSSCFMDPYGNIFPCLVWAKPLGNIREFNYDFKRFWQDPNVVRMQEDAEALRCPNCWTPCEAYQTIAGNMAKSLIKL
ncbi:radical SAM protein [Candidatus Woesearchaeota archaeon]|nr:radical SAM protein [Candidatus Woesearchaeota archaeon]